MGDDTKCAAADFIVLTSHIASFDVVDHLTNILMTLKEEKNKSFLFNRAFLTQSHKLLLLRSDYCLHSPHPFHKPSRSLLRLKLFFVCVSIPPSDYLDKSRHCSRGAKHNLNISLRSCSFWWRVLATKMTRDCEKSP